MIKNIVFDLDGVLFDGCDLHADLFLQSVLHIIPDIKINKDYHDKYLNGLPTKEKLKILKIKEKDADKIYSMKQELTNIHLSKIKPSIKNYKIIEELKHLGYNIYCVSNSIFSSITTILTQMGIISMFSGIISNEDTSETKPSPMPYLTLYKNFNIKPEECLILEDSNFGILSATQSGGFTLCVRNCDDVTITNILNDLSLAYNEGILRYYINKTFDKTLLYTQHLQPLEQAPVNREFKRTHQMSNIVLSLYNKCECEDYSNSKSL